jgi:site-specific recombinase XerD
MVTHRTQLITIRYSQNIILTSSVNNGWPEAHSRHKIQITPGSGQYVFVNLFAGRAGAAMTYPTVHQMIGRIAARTGVSFTAHMLRHSHATNMVRRGVPVEVAARLLTHQSSATTSQVYVHLDAADIREALRRAGVWQEETR